MIDLPILKMAIRSPALLTIELIRPRTSNIIRILLY